MGKKTDLGKEKIKLVVCNQKDSPPHNHDFLEMVYVIDGHSIHDLNGRKTVVKKGDYFIIEYGAVHQYRAIKNDEFIIINILFKPEFIDKILTDCRNFEDLINNYLIKFSYKALQNRPTDFIFHDHDQSVFSIIEKLQYEYENKHAGYLEIMRCYLIEIMIKTMRSISKSDANILYHDYSKFIVDYIEDNYMKPVKLSDISRDLNYSLTYLCKKFKKDVGQSFNDYLQQKESNKAAGLL